MNAVTARTLLYALIGYGIVLPGGVQAADADLFDLPLESLLEVKVNVASPHETSVQDSAASVAVLTPESWDRRSAHTLAEALEQVPAVSVYSSLGGAHMIAVRGYATELSARGIATLLDGVPLNNYSYATAIYDLPFLSTGLLDRVEMIRGPGSTLYGSDAFHGVVDIKTSRRQESTGKLAMHAGSDDNGGAVFTGSLMQDLIRIDSGIALTHRGDRNLAYGYTDPQSGQSMEGVRDHHEHDVAGFLHLETGDTGTGTGLWRASMFADRYRTRGMPAIGTQFYLPLTTAFQLESLNLGGARDVIGQDSGFWQMALTHQRELTSSLELEIKTFQWEGKQTWLADLRDYPLTLTTLGGTDLACRTSPTQAGVSPLYCPHTLVQGTADRRRGIEGLLKSRKALFGNTEWALGVGRNWFKIMDAYVRREPDAGAPYVITESPFDGASRHVDHLLLHARSDFADGKLAAVYGVRQDHYSDVGSATSPRLGLILHATENWTGKLLYSHAFRAPSAAEQFGGGTGSTQLPNPHIKPEEIDTAEVVWQYHTNQHDSEIVLFSSRWEDGIVLGPVGLGQNQYRNTGRNKAYGAELSHQRRAGLWRLEGNLSWVHSHNDTTETDYSAFPEWTINLGIGYQPSPEWEFWLNERVLLERTLTDVLGTSEGDEAPQYYRTDLYASWTPGKYKISVDIRNLFDRKNIAPAMYNAEGGLPDERISAHAGLAWKW